MNNVSLAPTSAKTPDATAHIWTDEETLIVDPRATLSPSQLVEQKLMGMLKTSSVMVSHMQRRLKPGSR